MCWHAIPLFQNQPSAPLGLTHEPHDTLVCLEVVVVAGLATCFPVDGDEVAAVAVVGVTVVLVEEEEEGDGGVGDCCWG